MSLSKFVLDSTDSITKKKSQRNKKLREQYAALSAQEKEIRLAKQREAYQRRKLNKFLALPAHEQLKQAEKSVIGETFRVHCNQAKVEDEQDRLAKKREMRRQKQREAYHKKKLRLSFGTHTSKDTEEIVDTAPATALTATMSTNCLSSEDLENLQKMESATSTADNILSAKVPSPENLQKMESVLPAANSILFAEVPSNSGLVIEKPVDTNAKETNLSQSNNNDKCKKHVTVFSSYDKGCSSNTKSSDKYICFGNSATHCLDERQLCSGCYNFLSQSLQELSEQSAPLSAIPPTTAPDNAKTSNTATQDNGQQTKSQARNSSRHCSVKRSRKKAAPAKGNTVLQGIDALNCIPHKSNKLPRKEDCQYCHAKKFHSETTNFCCSDGSIVLHDNKLPSVLVELFTAQTEEAICFRTYVRTYNNMFAFTSFGVHYDKALCKRNNGIYTFKIQGQTYHFINQLIPHHGPGMYLQLYFHDTDHELQNRMATSDRLTESLVIKIMEVMKTNPYACFFRSLRNVPQLDSYQIVLKSHTDNDQRVFNQPTASQITALWVEGENSANIYSRHIQIYTKEGYTHRIQYYYGCYDPLQYPLLFPLGETGWHPGIKRSEKVNPKKTKRATKKQQTSATLSNFCSAQEMIDKEEEAIQGCENSKEYVSMREYYAYKMQIRYQCTPNILNTGRLFQQFVVEMYVKIETQRLDFYRSRQQLIRREQLQGLMDSVVQGQSRGAQIGQKVILPASFIGGPRDMKSRYVDAMALVQKSGRPDIFITMTCNPAWPEIKEAMLLTDEAHNRPDLLSRVFHAKVNILKEDLFKKHIFGDVAAYTYVVEFQKRGLPHIHMLIILQPRSKLYSTESYDRIVSAEIPDEQANKHLFDMVRKHMMHGPCGSKNPKNVCMQGSFMRRCRNNYPKKWTSRTTHGNNTYPAYRRRNDGKKIIVRGQELDNRKRTMLTEFFRMN